MRRRENPKTRLPDGLVAKPIFTRGNGAGIHGSECCCRLGNRGRGAAWAAAPKGILSRARFCAELFILTLAVTASEALPL